MMNQKKFYINLYVLFPLIYSGISIAGIILAYQLIGYSLKGNTANTFSIFALIALIGFITYFLGYLIMRIVLKPVEHFFQKTQEMPIFENYHLESSGKIIDDVKEIEKAFVNVASILSTIEAKELFPHIIGSSASMRNVFTQIRKVAPTDSTVLISGESGTGKELIAESIYEHSTRKGKPFVKINCVAIPEGLLESELFGHEKGSFTGAVAQKKGKFEIANGGAVFLDEIGDMPMATQAKLLRVLQEKEFERVGGNVSIHVDIRFIAATNKDLPKMIKEGLFREDLYFRLNVFSINLPPLRERLEDIPLLANFFLDGFSKKINLSSEALQLMIGYSWPGNIRELKNVLEHACVLAEKETIELQHLPEIIRRHGLIDKIDKNNVPLNARLMIMEKEIIISALKIAGGVQVKAADILGINQRSLWHRIKKLNIDVTKVRNLH
jgi:two-component system, NtrC family, response regulator AtoC